MPTEALDQFIDMLLVEAKMDSLPEDFKATYRERLNEQVLKRLGLVVLEGLDENSAKEYAQLVESGVKQDSPKMQEFLAARIPDLSNRIQNALQDFAGGFLADEVFFITGGRKELFKTKLETFFDAHFWKAHTPHFASEAQLAKKAVSARDGPVF